MRATPDAIAFQRRRPCRNFGSRPFWSLSNIYLSLQGSRSHPPIQGNREAGRIPRSSLLAVVLIERRYRPGRCTTLVSFSREARVGRNQHPRRRIIKGHREELQNVVSDQLAGLIAGAATADCGIRESISAELKREGLSSRSLDRSSQSDATLSL